jgi:hypothetical protein
VEIYDEGVDLQAPAEALSQGYHQKLIALPAGEEELRKRKEKELRKRLASGRYPRIAAARPSAPENASSLATNW